MNIQGTWFDGYQSKPQPAQLTFNPDGLRLSLPDRQLDFLYAALTVSEQYRNGHYQIQVRNPPFADGTIECELAPDQQQYILAQGAKSSTRWAAWHHPNTLITSLIALVLVIVVAVKWLLPGLAMAAAPFIPQSFADGIGEAAYEYLYQSEVQPAQLLSEKTKRMIEANFDELSRESQEPARLEIVSLQASNSIGPNALALPNRTILLTEELVEQLDGDLDAVNAVLAHELGHLAYYHSMQALFSYMGLSAMSAVLFGDVSGAVTYLPALAMQMDYSRTAEAEADRFARDLLCAMGKDPTKGALVFNALGEQEAGLLSSHPGSRERSEFFEGGCVNAGYSHRAANF
ncbi:MAG: M48 family metallopeptidase [Gammaproteobacteria bacterium]|nr:M48 family metallopeptidase [Gammaproteobacteria bacterium]